MRRVVADASFCGAWILEDEASELAEGLLRQVETGDVGLVVPSLWHYEMLNLVKMAYRGGRLDRNSAEAAQKALSNVALVDIDVPDADARAVILNLAFEYELTAYDAAYMELAKRLNLEMYTFDRALIGAAGACGVEISI